jgi:hypothetical protein
MQKNYTVVFVAGLAVCSSAFGQTVHLLGKIINKATSQAISGATVRNVNSATTRLSKPDGSFVATASGGQVFAFSANGFYTDTLTITDSVLRLSGLKIALRTLPTTLADVTVSARLNPYQRDSVARRNEFLALVGKSTIPTVSRANDLGFGVGINLDRLGKTERHKRKARSLFDVLEEDAYVNYRWNETLVNKYTSLAGEPLYAFMQGNQPGYAWLRKHLAEEDLLYYINDRLKKQRM